MPLALKRVPARRQDRREISVKVDGMFETMALIGDEEAEMVIVETYPLMAEVKICDESRMALSDGERRERNRIRGLMR
jgi:hypothetical protein